MKELISKKFEELKKFVGSEDLSSLSTVDAEMVSSSKEAGELGILDNELKATNLAAKVASNVFLQWTDDEAEYVIEEEVDSKRIKANNKMASFHFIKTFDEDEWHCYKTLTTYAFEKYGAAIKGFDLEEIIPESGVTDDLNELVKYVHSVDRDFSESKATHVVNAYDFQSGGKSGISYR